MRARKAFFKAFALSHGPDDADYDRDVVGLGRAAHLRTLDHVLGRGPRVGICAREHELHGIVRDVVSDAVRTAYNDVTRAQLDDA
eukprot:7417316-Pyramimonas_sp.AAC.1